MLYALILYHAVHQINDICVAWHDMSSEVYNLELISYLLLLAFIDTVRALFPYSRRATFPHIPWQSHSALLQAETARPSHNADRGLGTLDWRGKRLKSVNCGKASREKQLSGTKPSHGLA